ncbi:hypothetical protein GCM10010140_04570 [Streptosporangium pseudovulgare]|uniref:Uncharacterized protein n=1 Tax=Streptosporangium pseudovulgare TaxID=35765 RepID=A0ABQ2QFS8_9ACTN|nr:hypothetical protein GCM10010140_04570 [Streptosporangium pseudovulgare]
MYGTASTSATDRVVGCSSPSATASRITMRSEMSVKAVRRMQSRYSVPPAPTTGRDGGTPGPPRGEPRGGMNTAGGPAGRPSRVVDATGAGGMALPAGMASADMR